MLRRAAAAAAARAARGARGERFAAAAAAPTATPQASEGTGTPERRRRQQQQQQPGQGASDLGQAQARSPGAGAGVDGEAGRRAQVRARAEQLEQDERDAEELRAPIRVRLSHAAEGARRSADPGMHDLDMLAMLNELEAVGFTREQAETASRVVVAHNAELWARSGLRFAEKLDLAKHEHSNEAARSVFHEQMDNRLSQIMSDMRRDVEGVSTELQRLRDDMRYEQEKLQTSHRLDMNLEKNRIKEEMQQIGDRIGHAEGRLERMVATTGHENKNEIQEVRTLLEASKSDFLRFGIGGVVSVVTVGLTYLRFFHM